MPKSLLYKLLGAFLLVTIIGSVVIAVLTSLATLNAFNIYTTRNGQGWAASLAPVLSEYYQRENSWQGVDSFIDSSLIPPAETTTGQGHGNGMGRQFAGNGFMGGSGQRILLLDVNDYVLADTSGELVGRQFSETQARYAVAILVSDKTVGKVLVTPTDMAGSGTPAGEFLSDVNSAIVSSAIIAGIIALLLGLVLFRQIISPLRKLKLAAAAIGQGDLSQRVQIESQDEFSDLGQAFNHMADSLASAEHQRQQLMADVAHELRTPLTAIQGTVEAMQDRLMPLDDEQLDAIYSQTALLNRLINDLRLLSLAEAGQLKLNYEVASISELITGAVDGLRSIAGLKTIQLRTELAEKLPEMRVDRDRLVQVINNLVSNSIRYTPPAGEIFISAHRMVDQNTIEISVADSGTGIEQTDLPHIFDRFYRADKSRNRNSGGSGLGLAIVRQLVEAHGGQVRAESPLYHSPEGTGYGTRISFTLPIDAKRD